MMSLDDLRKMPKELLQRLYDTAGALGYDDHMALLRVREELVPEWAYFCDPTLLERERELVEKMDRTLKWMDLLNTAMQERRPALRRIMAEDVLGPMSD